MNLKDPLWSHKEASDSAIDSFPNSIPPFYTNGTEAIIEAITESGTHLWSFQDYWIVTVPVVLATIFLPIIVGPVFRFSYWNLTKNTTFIVPILMLLTISASLATSLEDKFTVYTVLILFPFGLTAVWWMLKASMTGTDQILWCGYTITYGMSLWIDTVARDFRIINTPKGPWVSGLLPPVYLLVTHCGISNWIHVATILKDMWELFSKAKGAGRECCRVVLMVLYYGVAIAYWYNKRDRGTLLAIPFAILAANRLLSTAHDSDSKRLYIWFGFLVIWICSVVADRRLALSHNRFSGFFIAFFPMSALFGFWAYLDHKTRIRKIVRKYWRRKENQGELKSILERGDTLPAHFRREPPNACPSPLLARSRYQTPGASPVH